MKRVLLAALMVFGSLLAAGGAGRAVAAEASYTLQPDQHGVVLSTPDGRTVFRYMTKKPAQTKLTANSVCCLYPLKTPSGEDAVEFAPADHPHHRGVFLAWHAIGGDPPADFWGWGEWAPTEDRVIHNREVRLVRADARSAEVAVRNDWMAGGQVLLEETTTIRARQEQQAYVVELDFRLTPTRDLTLQQTAFGGFCVKGRKDGQATYFSPGGEVALPPPHHLKPETDWPAADWYDYVIRLDSGQTIGVAVVDHPANPPSLWHNLKPIAMVNPCIVAPGPVQLPTGKALRLRYCVVAHDGPAPTELLSKLAARRGD